MESSIIQFEIPTNMDLDRLALVNNYTQLLSGLQRQFQDSNSKTDNMLDNYGIVAVTIWIIIIFTFFTVTVVFCICSCLFYNKIRKWNRSGKWKLYFLRV